ncbi:hypothetical protein [Psychromicrobium xiongbiense]|uniref:hypothetical protein n=1 Tax=Psychromicrobium xiongbiense TaxID=3051184 RepID=UPI002555B735|nr:hypothetical protein [Psychromicrobium sp. YIM S02556]
MRFLFLGAGAVSAAALGLLSARHQVAVTSVPEHSRPHSPSDNSSSGRVLRYAKASRSGTSPVHSQPVLPWQEALDQPWDVIVLSMRPQDLDETRWDDLRASNSPWLATVSQVEGDLAVLADRIALTHTRSAIFAPELLSWRQASTDGQPAAPIRYWCPPGIAPFRVAVRAQDRAAARKDFAGVFPVGEEKALLERAAWMIPWAAELTAHEGDWAAFLKHLPHARKAMREARRASRPDHHSILPAPGTFAIPAWSVGLALRVGQRLAPLDFAAYLAEHFERHRAQTVDMLSGWIEAAPESSPTLRELRQTLSRTPGTSQEG